MNTIYKTDKTRGRKLTRGIAWLGLLAGVLLVQFSCYDDKGNYNYAPTDEISIDTTVSDYSLVHVLQRYEDLKIDPAVYINGEKVTDASNVPYDFTWVLRSTNTSGSLVYREDTLSTNRVLDAQITFPTGSWTLQLTIQHRDTGVQFYHKYTVIIDESVTDGWMVLYERDGNTDAGLIVNDWNKKYFDGQEMFYVDLYSSTNGSMLEGRPVAITHTALSLAGGGDIAIASENDVAIVNTTFTRLYGFSQLFWSAPSEANITGYCIGGQLGNYNEYIINNNQVHINGLSGMQVSRDTYKFEGAAIGTYGELVPTAKNGFGNFGAVLYDQDYMCFRYVASSGYRVESFGTQVSDAPFNLNNTGMKHLFSDFGMGATGTYTYSLMNNGSEYALLASQFIGSTGATTNIAKGKYDMSNCPDIANVTSISTGSIGYITYYSAGDGVYLFKPLTGNVAEKVWTAPAGETVTCVRIQKFWFGSINTAFVPNANQRIYFATWNESTQTGSVYHAVMDQTNGDIDLTEVRSYTGFGKITDMAMKWAMI